MYTMTTKQGTFNKPIFQRTLLPATCQSESNRGSLLSEFYSILQHSGISHKWTPLEHEKGVCNWSWPLTRMVLERGH